MFRALLAFSFVLCCLSVSFNSFPRQQFDDSDVVDNSGAGYSYFKKQQVDVRLAAQPNIPLLSQDLSEYMRSSALTQTPQTSRLTLEQTRPTINQQFVQPPRFNQQQFNLNQWQQDALQPVFTAQQRNAFGQFPQETDQTWSMPQQILLPQTNLNLQQRNFVQQPQQNWNQMASSNIQQREPMFVDRSFSG